MRTDEKRATFAAMLTEASALANDAERERREIQDAYRAELVRAATPTRGKPPKDANAAWKRLPEERRNAIREGWEVRAKAIYERQVEARDSLELDIRTLAQDVPVRPGAKRAQVAECSSSAYQSTCSGEAYARAIMRLKAAGLTGRGVELVVEPYWYGEVDRGPGAPSGYRVVALVEDDLDLEVLRRLPGLPLREAVRLCWELGANPRVFHPFLPPGFEEREGIDYFGNDLRASPPKAAL